MRFSGACSTSCSISVPLLATMPEDVHPKQARITAADSEQLEREIDRMNEELHAAAVVRASGRVAPSTRELHICRTVCAPRRKSK